MRNVHGERVYPTAQHLVPTSLTAMRLTLGYGLVPGGDTFFGDVEAAYTKAPLPGPPCFLELEPSLRPESWKKLGIRRPVMRLNRALYGHPLAGAAWNTLLAQWLLTHSWERVADAGEELGVEGDRQPGKGVVGQEQLHVLGEQLKVAAALDLHHIA